jgi:serine/threonine protein kinase
MSFLFPEHITLDQGTLKYFEQVSKTKFIYSLIDINTPIKNLISIDKNEYYFTYLNDTGKNKGGNSIILKLYLSQNLNTENIEYGEPDLILKILKFKVTTKLSLKKKIQLRFEKEIKALEKCKLEEFQNVIKIYHNGFCSIYNPKYERYDTFIYYTMEYAQFDLKGFVEENYKILRIEDKLSLSKSIAEGIKELDTLGYYHRDIKPDNIFMINNVWKVGDLGLVGEWNNNFDLDDKAEPIGPRGWMSPESMNKYFTEGKSFPFSFDCEIDHQSDIFQLGKVFWYIFQHNVPIGCIKGEDFKIKQNDIYSILRTMLNHSKKKRYKKIDDVIILLKKIDEKLLKSSTI